ncbi:hypothetical protein INR49_005486 [Caranx melampygus]|nr:hypothetical protein INR49_005486 [Caranx melampygus]
MVNVRAAAVALVAEEEEAFTSLCLCFRIKIEEEYAKNLSKLSLSPLAAQEEGTLGEAWTQLKKSLHDEAEVHLKFSNKTTTARAPISSNAEMVSRPQTQPEITQRSLGASWSLGASELLIALCCLIN